VGGVSLLWCCVAAVAVASPSVAVVSLLLNNTVIAYAHSNELMQAVIER
jgi:hypothetical protein